MQQKNLPHSTLRLENVGVNRPGNTEVRGGPSSGAPGLTTTLLRTFFFFCSFIHQIFLVHLLYEGLKFYTWNILVLAPVLAHL